MPINLRNRTGIAVAACWIVVAVLFGAVVVDYISRSGPDVADAGKGAEPVITVQAATAQQALVAAIRTATLSLPWLKPDRAEVSGIDATFVLTIAHGDGTGTALFKIKARQPFFGVRYVLATGEVVEAPRLISKRQAIEWMALEKSAGR